MGWSFINNRDMSRYPAADRISRGIGQGLIPSPCPAGSPIVTTPLTLQIPISASPYAMTLSNVTDKNGPNQTSFHRFPAPASSTDTIANWPKQKLTRRLPYQAISSGRKGIDLPARRAFSIGSGNRNPDRSRGGLSRLVSANVRHDDTDVASS